MRSILIRKNIFLGLIIIFLSLLVSPFTAISKEPLDGPAFGPADAPVVVKLFYDFQCGFCGKTAPVLYEVVKEYKGKVRLVTINVPGPGHAYALPSAELALTAADHGKFWEAFTLIFNNQSNLSNEYLIKYGKQLGLDDTLVKTNLETYAHKDILKRNFYGAMDLGISSTPTVYIGEKVLVGVQDANAFRYYFNQALEAKGIQSPVGPVPAPKTKEDNEIADRVPSNMIYPVKVEKPVDSKLKVKLGDKAPDFTLTSIEGEEFTLSNFKGKMNVVISFVPAAWTPVCSEQWPDYRDNKDVFTDANAILIGISTDNLPSLYSWTGTMGALWFPVASDFYPHGKVAKSFGVLRSSGVAERAVFVIDKEGIIRYIEVHDINSAPNFKALKEALSKLNN